MKTKHKTQTPAQRKALQERKELYDYCERIIDQTEDWALWVDRKRYNAYHRRQVREVIELARLGLMSFKPRRKAK